jgi:hypothetical protein
VTSANFALSQGGYLHGAWPKLLEEVKFVPGDIIEFGVFEGYNCLGFAEMEPSRQVWAFDTFVGMPGEDHNPELDSSNPPGKWLVDKAAVQGRLRELPNIHIMEGRFADTLPRCHASPIALAHIDCDTYAGYTQVLGWLVPRLAPGSIVVQDDHPGCAGATKAIEEFKLAYPTRARWRDEHSFIWDEVTECHPV